MTAATVGVGIEWLTRRFPQFFPSSELTRRWTNPWTAPTLVHERNSHG